MLGFLSGLTCSLLGPPLIPTILNHHLDFRLDFSRPLDGPVEVSLDIAGLRVTVRGDSAKVADFVQFVGSFTGQRARSPTNSVGSFELLCEPPAASSAPSGRVGLETREQISASFAACPDRLLSWGNKLSGANLAGRDRASRAWVAGLWARAVVDRRVHSPNRTPPLDLRSQFYAVARADSVDCPVVFRSSTSYWRAIGSLEGSSSVSQSFPSEAECRIYLLAAGFSGGQHPVLALIEESMALDLIAESPLTFASLVTVEEDLEPYVLEWPPVPDADGSSEALVVVVLKRQAGFLLAVPRGFIPQQVLDRANQGVDGGPIGPSTVGEVDVGKLTGNCSQYIP